MQLKTLNRQQNLYSKTKTMLKNNLIALGVCALWIGAGYILFNLFYQRKGIDC